MTVGETTADARGAAGLSVNEVSERTRIRETVIRSIERDDFDALGGDLYVRGYLRAIAGAVGVDPQPLIREFDAVRGVGPAGWPTIGGGPGAMAADSGDGAVTGADDSAAPAESPVPASAPDATAAVATSASPAATTPAAEPPDAIPELGANGSPATPVAGDQPAAADEPELLDESAELGEPASAGQMPSFDQSALFDQATVFDESIGAGDFPTRVDEPLFFGQSLNEDYPTLADQSAILDEPTVVDAWGTQSWNPITSESETQASDDYHPFWADDAVSDADPAPVAQAAFAEPTVAITAAERASLGGRPGAAGSGLPPRRPARRSRVRGWRWATVISVLAVVVLGVVGVASGQIVAKLRHTDAAPSATPTAAPSVVTQTTAPTPSPTPTPTPTPTATAPPKPPPVPARQLTVRSAAAYGPAGTADGDHPEKAWNVIAADPAQPWQTAWYATARFGGLKSGTGLLLDMGHRVTITSLRIRLGSAGGASLQVLAGDAPAQGSMPVEASAQDVSGPWTLRFAKPARARYVIIWFTKLPPIGAGQYRVSVYSVTVSGRP